MKNKWLVLPVLMLGLLNACQKIELGPSLEDTPVFRAELDVEGALQTLTAGKEDYYLFTEKTENLNINEFSGKLKQENCADECGPSLRIIFRDSADFASGFLTPGNYPFKELFPSFSQKIRLRMEAVPHGIPPYEHRWEFEDLPDLTGDQVAVDFDLGTTQKVKLTTTDSEGCQNVSEKQIDLTDMNTVNASCGDFIFFIEPQDSSGTGFDPNVFVFLFSEFGVPDSAIWNDGTIGFINTFHIDSLDNEICATVLHAGCEETLCLSISPDPTNPQGGSGICGTQFTVKEEVILIPGNLEQTGTVLIEYTDESGVVYNSENVPQTNSAFFNVSNPALYDLNEQGEPTLKFDFELRCKLGTITGQTVEINSGQGTFAIRE